MKITIGDFSAVYVQNTYLNVRLAVRLDDKVDSDILRVATEQVSRRYPYLCVRFAVGDGEYYLEENPLPVKTMNRKSSVLLLTEDSNYHPWAVSYYDDYIFLDVYHGLSDGNHMYRMLSTLLYYYMSKKYRDVEPEDILTLDVPISKDEIDDPLDTLPIPDMSGEDQPSISPRPAFKCVEDGGDGAGEHTFYDITISEKEFVKFATENGSSPGNMVALLMARGIDSLFPESDKPPVGYYFINCRPMLGAVNSFHNCISMVRFVYDKSVKELSFGEQCRLYRERTKAEIAPENIRRSMALMAYKTRILMKLPTIEEKERAVKKLRDSTAPFATYGVSYVGKWKYKSLEKHITEFWTHVVGRSEISIEMAAVNGNIFISYQQGIKDESYLQAFLKELSDFGIPYKLVRKMPVDVAKVVNIQDYC